MAMEPAKAPIPGGEVKAEKQIKLIPFFYNLAPLEGVTLEEVAPFDGFIKQVIIHWPDGCNALVEVKVTYDSLPQFCPSTDYLALNNATPTFSFNVEVQADFSIIVEMRNGDAVNSHAITVTVSVEGAVPWP